MYKKTAVVANPKGLLLLAILLLIFFGAAFVYNASTTYAYNVFGNVSYFLINQVSWITLSLLVFTLIQFLPLNLVKNAAFILYFVNLLFLIFLAISSLFNIDSAFSENVYGAYRWVNLNPDPLPSLPLIGKIGFQPSELNKLLLCIFLPGLILLRKLDEKSVLIKSLFYVLLPAFLIILEPDLKSTLITLSIGIGILFVYGIHIKYFVYISLISLPLIALLVVLSPYRMQRVIAFFGEKESASSYHVRQINIALGAGGFTGLGLGQSRQKNEYLPEVMGDSIFAIIGEELGFIGSTFVLFLLTAVLFLLYKSINYIFNTEKKLITIGIFIWYGFQVFLNLGAISGVIPLTGVPLPFISYGGSSMLFLVTAFGLVYKFLREE